MEILFGILTIVLVLVSIVMVLLVLMQRGSANGGLGAAMGGGMAESAFGAETSNVLSKLTTKTAILFFVMVFGLYLAQLWLSGQAVESEGTALPEFAVEDSSSPENVLKELLSESAALQDAASNVPVEEGAKEVQAAQEAAEAPVVE